MRAVNTTDRPTRELVRDVLGNAVDDLTDRQCGRILCVMFATATRELEQTHAHDNQLKLDAA